MGTFDVDDVHRWFYGNISRKRAENLLMRESENGVFLVRDSSTRPGDYVLSVKVEDSVQHFIIEAKKLNTPSEQIVYKSGMNLFSSFPNLLEHFKLNFLVNDPKTTLVCPPQLRPQFVRLPEVTVKRLSLSLILPIEATVITAYIPMGHESGALRLEVGEKIWVTDMNLSSGRAYDEESKWEGVTKDGMRGHFPSFHVSLGTFRDIDLIGF